MEIEVSFEELRKRKIFLATPMYGGNCTGIYTKSVNDLTKLCQHYGIELKHYYLFNESLITRARNYCVDDFMRSDCTHLMFIDSDIGFNANDVISLLALASNESEYDVICGPYPKKVISWEKIVTAVNKGAGDENPNNLEKYVGDYVFNPAPGIKSFRIDQPVEVLESGTGFMMIRKQTFEKYAEKFKEYLYKPDHVRSEHFDGSREIMAYFDCIIDPKSRRYLSEDYFFCQNVRKIGMKVWLCPWMEMTHMGSYGFGGSLRAIAGIGEHATTNPAALKKKIAENKETADVSTTIPELGE